MTTNNETPATEARTQIEALLLKIAQSEFSNDLETLETRNSDSLDFHEVGIREIHDALQAAYFAGCAAASSDRRAANRVAREVKAEKAAKQARIQAMMARQ